MLKTILIGAGVALLAGCEGGAESVPGASFCETIGGGGAQATEVCGSNCSQDNIAASVDADFASAAVLGVSVQNQGTLRGTAQDGVVFAADKPAGVYVDLPPFVNGASFELTVSTFLDGAPQESSLAYSEGNGASDNFFCNYCARNGNFRFFGIPTNLPFDAIEISYAQSGTQYREIRVFEFCRLN